MRLFRRFLPCTLAAAACECGEDPTLQRLVPNIEVGVPSVDFGEVPIGATKRISIAIANTGTAELAMQSADATAPFGAAILDFNITPSSSGRVDVSFTPTNDQAASGTLTLVSNDPDGPVQVSLLGRGVAGALTVRPSLIELRNTAVGAVKVQEIVISNLGVADVSGRLLTEGFARPEHFSLTSLPNFASAGMVSVGMRGEVVLDLEYRPIEFGDDTGRILFEVCGDRCGIEVVVLASASQAIVRLVPPLVDFGGVGIGETRTQQVVLENTGMEPVDVLSVSTAGGSELSASIAPTLPATLAGGTSLGINVEFTPASAVAFAGEVIVATTDPLAREIRASVIGTGEGPLFVVAPEAIDFGAQRDQTVHRRSLLLINAGSSAVSVTDVTIAGDPVFGLSGVPGFPARIGSGESVVVNVTFDPTLIGEYTGTVTVKTDDPARPVVDVPVIGGLTDRLCELRYAPDRLNFGLIPPSYIRNKTTTLTNIGTDDCTLLSGAFRAPIDPYFALVGAPFPLTLAPSQAVAVEFSYAPLAEVESKGNFVIQTDDPVFPERNVSLLGTAEGYVNIFTVPTSVDFGSVRPLCSAPTAEVTIFNAGTINAEVASMTLTATTPEIQMTAPARPFMLPAGGSQPFHLDYTAADFGVDLGEVEIIVRDLAYPLILPLRGEGNATPRIKDIFTQSRQEDVDVLFVIDDSCSMGDDQAALAMNFSSFIMQANLRSVDFQIGITTTTVFPVAGHLVGPILTPSTPSLEAAFTAQANVGVYGSGFETGLDAMYGVLQLAAGGVAPQRDLIRPNAGLAVIIVSDEDDQSFLPTVNYFNELRNSAPNGYVTAVVTGGMSGCVGATGSGDPSPRYLDFAALTGGISESICSPWASTLATIGNGVFGLEITFPLSQPADPSQPIVVTVNGSVVPRNDWTYDTTTASVTFTNPPPDGAQIEIEFTPDC